MLHSLNAEEHANGLPEIRNTLKHNQQKRLLRAVLTQPQTHTLSFPHGHPLGLDANGTLTRVDDKSRFTNFVVARGGRYKDGDWINGAILFKRDPKNASYHAIEIRNDVINISEDGYEFIDNWVITERSNGQIIDNPNPKPSDVVKHFTSQIEKKSLYDYRYIPEAASLFKDVQEQWINENLIELNLDSKDLRWWQGIIGNRPNYLDNVIFDGTEYAMLPSGIRRPHHLRVYIPGGIPLTLGFTNPGKRYFVTRKSITGRNPGENNYGEFSVEIDTGTVDLDTSPLEGWLKFYVLDSYRTPETPLFYPDERRDSSQNLTNNLGSYFQRIENIRRLARTLENEELAHWVDHIQDDYFLDDNGGNKDD